MVDIITILLVVVIVALSLKKYVKMSKEGYGCGGGCSGCPNKEKCSSNKENEK